MDRTIEIIKLLINTKGYITMDDMARELKVTTRTLRSDLSVLEESGICIKKKRNSGIKLDFDTTPDVILQNFTRLIEDNKDFYTAEERSDRIITRLLFGREPATIEELKEITLSSRSSVMKNLADCEARLKKWQIRVVRQSRQGIIIQCTERQWRMAVLEHVMHYVEQMDFHRLYENLSTGSNAGALFASGDFICQIVSGINPLSITNFIRRYENKNKLLLTDKAFIAAFFFLAIAITRIREGKRLKDIEYHLDAFFQRQYIDEWIDDNIGYLSHEVAKGLDRCEMEAIFIFLLSQKQYWENGFLENVFVEDTYFNKKTEKITRAFIRRVGTYLNIELSDDESLYNNLLLHIRPAIFRLLFGIKVDNPLLQDIKRTYPAVYSACADAGEIIPAETGARATEEEIGYLAMHVGAAIEKNREKRFSGVYCAAVICPEGKGTSSILYYRLLNSVPNIQIVEICSLSDVEKIDRSNIDLMISTVPLFAHDDIDVIQVNPLLTEEDIAKIRRAIKRINMLRSVKGSLLVEDLISIISRHALIREYEPLQQELESYFNRSQVQIGAVQPSLSNILRPSLIRTRVEADDWKNAFRIAGKLLLEEGYIREEYIERMIYNAEKYGGYMIITDGVALPHAKASDGVIKTGLAFVTLAHPVVFENETERKEIYLIAALAADDSMSHLTATGEFIEQVCRPEVLRDILNAENPKEFIRCLENDY